MLNFSSKTSLIEGKHSNDILIHFIVKTIELYLNDKIKSIDALKYYEVEFFEERSKMNIFIYQKREMPII
jgi:hypothetical protein